MKNKNNLKFDVKKLSKFSNGMKTIRIIIITATLFLIIPSVSSAEALPDLSALIGDTAIFPSSGVVGQALYFSSIVSDSGWCYNQPTSPNCIAYPIAGIGNAYNFPNSFQVYKVFNTNTDLIATVNANTVAFLAPGASTPVSTSYFFSSTGTYYVRVCANWNGNIANSILESDSMLQNNCGNLATVSIYASALGTVNVSSNIPSASWTINGPATLPLVPPGSGTSANYTSQPTGTYAINWGNVEGYTTPVTQDLTLTTGGTITFSGTYTPIVVAACGYATSYYNGKYYNSIPPSLLCSAGMPSAVSLSGSSWVWNCIGESGGGTTASCSASRCTPTYVDNCVTTPPVCTFLTARQELTGIAVCNSTSEVSCNDVAGSSTSCNNPAACIAPKITCDPIEYGSAGWKEVAP